MKKLTISLLIIFGFLSFRTATAAPGRSDTLRVDTVLATVKHLQKKMQGEILPKLSVESKAAATAALTKLKQTMATAETSLKSRMKTPVTKLKSSEKKLLRDINSQVNELRSAVPEKSDDYPAVAKAHIMTYKAVQETDSTGRKPLLSTYAEPYDPNTSRNKQVTLVGAYLNFDLEYRLKVGGIDVGPDIVDADRVVFTFPEKLLEGMTAPTYFEIKASPKMQSGIGKAAKVQPYKEQTIYLLALPVKS